MDYSSNGIFMYNKILEKRSQYMPVITDIGIVKTLLRSAVKNTTMENIERLNCKD